ncbi:uncharacterized protein ARMOST_16791 [Armillaria ostoyae]|uniref:Uncharacterized protein n=1 Tax=Armillaria ostoyae TaxID=47428 RepID=A0A284RXA3_ARMOS|nr:uncharacterized protein ARMOST_16791 [Armillaria ostoyae]
MTSHPFFGQRLLLQDLTGGGAGALKVHTVGIDTSGGVAACSLSLREIPRFSTAFTKICAHFQAVPIRVAVYDTASVRGNVATSISFTATGTALANRATTTRAMNVNVDPQISLENLNDTDRGPVTGIGIGIVRLFAKECYQINTVCRIAARTMLPTSTPSSPKTTLTSTF